MISVKKKALLPKTHEINFDSQYSKHIVINLVLVPPTPHKTLKHGVMFQHLLVGAGIAPNFGLN